MKRRQLLKNIVVISSGLVIFPACDFGKTAMPVYDNLSLDKDQFQLISTLADSILPKGELVVTNPEPTNEFILTMVNDCYSVEDCEQYVTGLKAFRSMAETKYNKVFSKLDKEKQVEFLKAVASSEDPSEPAMAAKFFLDTTRRHTLQHFTGSDYFLSKHTDWKFIPGDYEGCVPV